MGYVSQENLSDFYTGLKSRFAKVADYSGTFLASGWSGSAPPYMQTITITGLKASDRAWVGWDFSGATASNYDTLKDNFYMIGRVAAGTNSLTAYCYEEKPTMNLPVLVTVVKTANG